MKYLSLLYVLLGLSIVSCSAPEDERATALCDCYKQMHRVNPDTDIELLNFIADSCKTLHIEILTELESKPEEKTKFNEAYEFCQNEK